MAHAFTHSNLLRQRLNAASQLVERAQDLQTQKAQAQAPANTTSDCTPSNASEKWLDGMLVRPTLALTRALLLALTLSLTLTLPLTQTLFLILCLPHRRFHHTNPE